MLFKFAVFSVFLSGFLTATAAQAHREHGKHLHGHAELSIAFEGAQGKIEFKTPADAIVGFEHEAKTAEQKKTVEDATKKFADRIVEMVKWDPLLSCQFKAEKIEIHREKGHSKHSEFTANFDVTCVKSPQGTTVTFDFQTVFPKLRNIDATVLVDNAQKSLKIKSTTSLKL